MLGRAVERFFQGLLTLDPCAWGFVAFLGLIFLLLCLFSLKVARDFRKEDEQQQRKRYGKDGSERPKFDPAPPRPGPPPVPVADDPTAITADPAITSHLPREENIPLAEEVPRRRRVVHAPSGLKSSDVSPTVPILIVAVVVALGLCFCVPIAVISLMEFAAALQPSTTRAAPGR